MGTQGMKYSLVSREVIADSIETVMGCELLDGLVAIGGCDKNMPGCLMAIARLNRPSVFVYGGTILPGCFQDKDADIVTVFEGVGAHAQGKLDDRGLQTLEQCAIPGPGSCGGMYTANTMACAIEALGMSLPNSSAQNAISPEKKDDALRAGAAVHRLLGLGIRPLDIMTRKAFENAITVVIALGGSTNAVLHLLAIAHSAGVKLHIDDFTKIGKRVPVLADLKPSGKYQMSALVKVGGLTPLMKMLLDRGLLHGDCLTVTGQTVAENLRNVKPYAKGQDVIHGFDNPIKPTSHLVVFYGNLAPTGGVGKISGKEGEKFTGTARVFDSEEQALFGILAGRIKAGDVVVIRYEGPRGGPGMREMLAPTSAIMGRGPGQERGAHHRRTVLRRHARLRGRPHLARGARGRPARAGENRRHDQHRRDQAGAQSRDPRQGNGRAAQAAQGAPAGFSSRRARQIREPRQPGQPRRDHGRDVIGRRDGGRGRKTSTGITKFTDRMASDYLPREPFRLIP